MASTAAIAGSHTENSGASPGPEIVGVGSPHASPSGQPTSVTHAVLDWGAHGEGRQNRAFADVENGSPQHA
jgi:hypothetical protein